MQEVGATRLFKKCLRYDGPCRVEPTDQAAKTQTDQPVWQQVQQGIFGGADSTWVFRRGVTTVEGRNQGPSPGAPGLSRSAPEFPDCGQRAGVSDS